MLQSASSLMRSRRTKTISKKLDSDENHVVCLSPRWVEAIELEIRLLKIFEYIDISRNNERILDVSYSPRDLCPCIQQVTPDPHGYFSPCHSHC